MGSFFRGIGKRLVSGFTVLLLAAASMFGAAGHAGATANMLLSVKADNTSYAAGKVVSVTLSLSDVEDARLVGGLAYLSLAISYPTSIFSADDYVTVTDGKRVYKAEGYSLGEGVTGQNFEVHAPVDITNESTGYNQVQLSLLNISGGTSSIQDGDLLTFKLKVKENAPDSSLVPISIEKGTLDTIDGGENSVSDRISLASAYVNITSSGGSPGGGTTPEPPARIETGISLIPNDKLLLTAPNKQSIAVFQKFSNDTTESLSAESVTWSSSDETVATVDDKGFVTALAKGVSVITAKHNGFEAKINAIVYTPDAGKIMSFGITGASDSNKVKVGGKHAFTASLKYSDHTTKDVTKDAVWVSMNPGVCTVKDGVVTGVSPGSAELKIYYAGEEYNTWVLVEAGSSSDGSTGENPPGDSSGGNPSNENPSGGNTGTNPGTTTGTGSTTPAQPSAPPTTEVFNTKVVNPEAVVSKVQNLVSSATPAASFEQPADVKGNWAEKTIDMFLKLNIIKGYTDGTVKPNQTITRAEFVGILSRIFDVQGTSTVAFKDVTGNNWAKTAIEQFAAAGVINGYSNGEFKPNQTITREEMVIVLSRLINLKSVASDASKGGFSDVQGAKAADSIQQAAQAGIISGAGNGTFAPEGNATRAEALTIILNVLNLNGQIKTMLDSLE